MFKARFSTSNTMKAEFSSSEPMKAAFTESIRPEDGSVTVNGVLVGVPGQPDTIQYQMQSELNPSSGIVTSTFLTQDYVTADVTEGFVHNGTKRGLCDITANNTLALPTQAAQTITPSNAAQTIAAGKFLTGAQSIEAVTHNLSASDLRSGVTVKIGTATDDDSVASVAGTYAYNPFGDNAEIIATYAKQSFVIKNTAFNGWTPSTTAKTIQATANLGTAVLDLDNYEYFTKFFVESNIKYASGTTLLGAPIRQLTGIYQYIYRKPTTLANLGTKTDSGAYCTTIYTSTLLDYYNTNGSHVLAYPGSYGFYGAATAHTFSSSSSLTPTLTIKRPALTARCSGTYFTTSMAPAVDQDNSKMEVWGWLFRCKKGSFGKALWTDLIDIYNT